MSRMEKIPCAQCGKKCGGPQGLAAHMRKHVNGTVNGAVPLADSLKIMLEQLDAARAAIALALSAFVN